jgi:hypothetical protein
MLLLALGIYGNKKCIQVRAYNGKIASSRAKTERSAALEFYFHSKSTTYLVLCINLFDLREPKEGKERERER